MTISQTGLLVHFDEARRAELVGSRINHEDSASFSDALSVPDWKIKTVEVAIISFSGTSLDYMAIALKGPKVVTGKARIEFFHLIDLQSVNLEDIERRLDNSIRSHFIRVSQGSGSRIPRATWRALIEALRQERSEIADEIDNLFRVSSSFGIRLLGGNIDLLAQERDALGTALEIFSGDDKLRKQVLRMWNPLPDEIQETDSDTKNYTGKLPFFLARQRISEESAIQHDLNNFPEFSGSHEFGTTVFQKGERRLDVVYANRNALETTLGVDLIYYNQTLQFFVLVQYKMMEKEHDGGQSLYRPDQQLFDELERMRVFYKRFKTTNSINRHEDFRFSDDGFFIKLIPKEGIKVGVSDLSKGMYIPRLYMEFLIGDYGPRGPNGGRQINFQNSKRYLTNSQFVENVHEGWFGSNAIQSDKIHEVIQYFYETGNAIVFATESSTNQSLN